jgi:hypothetical protein
VVSAVRVFASEARWFVSPPPPPPPPVANPRQGRGTNHCNKELLKISHVRKDFVALTDRNIWGRISLTYRVYSLR